MKKSLKVGIAVVWVMGKKYMGTDRTTYILDENGIIIKIYEKVKPIGHAKDVSAFLAG